MGGVEGPRPTNLLPTVDYLCFIICDTCVCVGPNPFPLLIVAHELTRNYHAFERLSYTKYILINDTTTTK